MQIDANMLNRLLAMNDEQLSAFIRGVAAEAGIDPAALGLDPNHVAQIRAALGGATEQDLKQLNDVYETYRKNRRKH
ncbi:MAG: hypothetical protein IKJ35_09635 [Clostridia bacterium]|nr:hypothetical protein [Clostridia bacterium]